MGDCYHPRIVLTVREARVFSERLRGLSVKEIAVELHISPHTARHHIEHIYKKLGAHSQRQAVNAILGSKCQKCYIGILALYTKG